MERQKPVIKLDRTLLGQIMKAYVEIDDVTDMLNSVYGDNWHECNPLGSTWSTLHEVIEFHVGEDNVDKAVDLYQTQGIILPYDKVEGVNV